MKQTANMLFLGLAVLLPAAASETPAAKWDFTLAADRLLIACGGEPAAAFVFKDERILRPYFANIRVPGGIQVTRNHPPIEGADPTDHNTMHPGVWLAFGDINGADFWRNRAQIEHVRFTQTPRVKNDELTFATECRLLNAANTKLCSLTNQFHLAARPGGWRLVWEATFYSETSDFTFGDQEEMGFGARVATAFTEKNGGEILSSQGLRSAAASWGQPAAWCDYSGIVERRHVGILLMADPANFRTSWWHNRDYGLMVANPFGREAMKQGAPSAVTVRHGEPFHLRFGALFYAVPADTEMNLARAHREFAGDAGVPHPAKDHSYTNSLGMRMVRIESGRFQMGSAQGDFDELPVHAVTLPRSFWMATTEVSNAQYEQFDAGHRRLRGKLGFSSADEEAVVFVSWDEATAFCAWLSKKEGRTYRLPTEAEWEYACRAGTVTEYSTGDRLPEPFHQNPALSWFPDRRTQEGVVPLPVGRTPPNPWGLFDMHGNVEEWCFDWYGPYPDAAQRDPVGRADGDFRVTRGGSHSTTLAYLRSANRSGTLPDDRSWLIGFRVVQADMPSGIPLPPPAPPRNAREVRPQAPPSMAVGPDPERPYFNGPVTYVKAPPPEECPVFNRHNHCPALVNCANGDLLAIWYTCATEPGRELGIVASRLPHGSSEWQTASDFWDAPDRNDHASALWVDEKGILYHFNGLSAAATWGSLATILRTSSDHGATWSRARLIMPEHGLHHMPVESVIRTREGAIVVPCDAVTGGNGGTAVLVSLDGGQTWSDPGQGRPAPDFNAGGTGAWIAGIHAGLTQRIDGRLMAFGRGDSIDGRMPMSLSGDLGRSWTYEASPFLPIGGGQRLAILRLREGPILFCSFARKVQFRDRSGTLRTGSGLFAALSEDEGRTWSIKRLITDDGPPRTVDGGGNTGAFTLSALSAEPKGYLSICQAADGVIHLISSKQHYAFNLAWLNTPPPVPPEPGSR